jgi:hypothetical protein
VESDGEWKAAGRDREEETIDGAVTVAGTAESGAEVTEEGGPLEGGSSKQTGEGDVSSCRVDAIQCVHTVMGSEAADVGTRGAESRLNREEGGLDGLGGGGELAGEVGVCPDTEPIDCEAQAGAGDDRACGLSGEVAV